MTGPSIRSADNIPSACNITAISSAASNYFPKKDAGLNSVTALKNDLRASGGIVNAATTKDVFAIFSRIAILRHGNLAGSAASAATLVDDALACTTFAASVPSSFNALESLSFGIFEVTPTNAHVEAVLNATGANFAAPSPRWGAEPAANNASGKWPSAGDFLVYGYPLSGGSDLSQGFELGTLPANVVNPSSTTTNPMTVAICSSSTVVTNGKASAANLLVHNGNEILSLQHVNFCTQTFAANSSNSWFASLTTKVRSYFSPSVAWAQDASDLFSTGGPSGWSPFNLQTFQASDVSLVYTRQPVNTTITGNLDTVQVTASTAGGATAPENIVLTVAGNHGTPTFLTLGGTAVSSLTASTVLNGDGTATATFIFGFTKAGGYTLSATGYLGGGVVATAPALSALFQVQNK